MRFRVSESNIQFQENRSRQEERLNAQHLKIEQIEIKNNVLQGKEIELGNRIFNLENQLEKKSKEIDDLKLLIKQKFDEKPGLLKRFKHWLSEPILTIPLPFSSTEE